MGQKLIQRSPCDKSAPLRVGVLVSNSGAALQGLLDACDRGDVAASIELVLSDRKDAPALERARTAGLTTRVIPTDAFESSEAFDRAVLEALVTRDVELICLIGYSAQLSDMFYDAYWPRVLDLHPSLLPAFATEFAIADALDAGVRITGCTLRVRAFDAQNSPIFLQSALRVWPSDDEESLTVRLRILEQRLLVDAIKLVCQGRVELDRDRILVDAETDQDRTLEWLCERP